MRRLPISTAGQVVFLFCVSARVQVAVSGRVVDETGEGVSDARIEIRGLDGGDPVVAAPASESATVYPERVECAVSPFRPPSWRYSFRVCRRALRWPSAAGWWMKPAKAFRVRASRFAGWMEATRW
ncbi:exported hypothetical protein [Candidatus Sulfopaludibacter sp. SbA3]|nr:exported hypothetical protein [Candidatus Sulfopaludibacter sp. SbA3]